MSDLVAGLSVGGILLPEAVAYAGIAHLPVGHALTAAVIGLLVYPVIGRSRFAMVAPTSSSAALLAAVVVSMAAGNDVRQVDLAMGLVLLSGALFVAASLARLGQLASYVSRPVLRGFAFALALTIIAKQLPIITGLHVETADPLRIAHAVLARSAQWHWPSVGLAALAWVVLSVCRRWRQVPGALLVLVGGIALSYAIDLPARGIEVVGEIAPPAFALHLPSLGFKEWAQLAQTAAGLVVILFAESWGSIRSLGLRHGEAPQADRELLSLGVANLLAGLARGMPVGAGFSASSASEAAGAKTRLAGVVAACAIAAVSWLALPLIERIPQPVLSAAVISALTHSLDPRPLLRLWRLDRDPLLALAAVLAVMLLGLLDGMLAAVGLSVVGAVRRFSEPVVHELGQLGDTHNFLPQGSRDDVHRLDRVLIMRPEEPLFFASAERVLDTLRRLLEARQPTPHTLVLSLEESGDLDSTAADALVEFDALLTGRGQRLLLARVKEPIRRLLRRAAPEQFDDDSRFFWSVADAADAAVRPPSAASGPPDAQSSNANTAPLPG